MSARCCGEPGKIILLTARFRGTLPYGRHRWSRECVDLRSTPHAARARSPAQSDLGSRGDWRGYEMARHIVDQKARGSTDALHIPGGAIFALGMTLVRLIVFRATR